MTEASGKLALVTGGTGGIGRASAEGLARCGFRLVVTGRDPGRGARAVAELTAVAGAGRVEFEPADLGSQRQTRELAARVLARHDRLDVLVNNAGGQYPERTVTEDGHEGIFATNVVDPLLLTLELLPALRRAAPSRVVFVSSDAHQFAKLDLDDLDSERFYRALDTYARAKLLQVLVARELARRLEKDGVAVHAVNPGAAWTPQTARLRPHMVPPFMRLYWPVLRLVQRRARPEKAATSTLVAAADPALDGRTGLWITSSGKVGQPGRRARDDDAAREVYERIRALLPADVASDV
ncbi:MAG: SDR family NAD(P)-dependent oxidoreductase [Mycobacteriales bacterium]